MQRKHNSALVPFARELRKNMTEEERRLWYEFLRQYTVKFTRQKVLGRFIADFYCAKAKLVVELDGSQHFTEENREKDEERTEFLKGYGIEVIRISNNEIKQNFRGVCEYIDSVVNERMCKG